jgi:putative Holliday junction resolvase
VSRRVLALDVGTRRIGLALSDALGLTAQPLAVLERRGAATDLETIARLAGEHQVVTILVGLPLTLAGARGPQARLVETFARRLQGRVAVPIELVDERLTTAESERLLLAADASRRKRKRVRDQMAAQLILQQYLERRRTRRQPEDS